MGEFIFLAMFRGRKKYACEHLLFAIETLIL